MTTIKLSGVYIGGVRTNFPGCALELSSDCILIRVPLLGVYKLKANEVATLESVKGFLGTEVTVKHINRDNPKTIRLGVNGTPEQFLEKVSQSGFSPSALPEEWPSGIPAKWSFLISSILVWNLLMWLGIQVKQFHQYAVIALTILFAVCVLAPRSAILQSIILKDGRRIGELVPFFTFMRFLAGIVLIVSILRVLF